MDKRRSWKSLLINPDAQIRYGTIFLSLAVVVHAVSILVIAQIYSQWRMNEMVGHEVSIIIYVTILIGTYAILYGLAFGLGLLISHRLYGPLRAVNNHLARIKAGDYTSRIHLRKADDEQMKQLADGLNELADTLEKKKTS